MNNNDGLTAYERMIKKNLEEKQKFMEELKIPELKQQLDDLLPKKKIQNKRLLCHFYGYHFAIYN